MNGYGVIGMVIVGAIAYRLGLATGVQSTVSRVNLMLEREHDRRSCPACDLLDDAHAEGCPLAKLAS